MTDPSLVPPTAAADVVLCGRYRLQALLAIGGMAEVWRAEDELLGRPVAVKVLHRHLAADAGFVNRFRSEAVAAARLHHPGIVTVFDTCSDGGLEAIVLELVEGHTLRQHLDAHGPLPVLDAIDIAAAVADALSVAHAAGLVHRDVKPANILLCDDDRVMITDFGIAKLVDTTDRTATGAMLGSVKYLSPEQVEGAPVDGRSDLFSLGIVLYEMLAGRPPWMAEQPAAIALARLHAPPPPLSPLRHDLPVGLEALVLTTLAVDPARRPTSATDLRDRLVALRSAPPAPPTAGPTAGPVPPIDTDATIVADRPVAVTLVAPPGPPTATTPPGPGDRPPASPEPVPRSRRGLAAGVLVALLVIVGIGVAIALLLDDDTSRELRAVMEAPLAGPTRDLPATATAFDPQGTGPPGENDGQAAAAVDGDPLTAWTTEGYDARDFGIKEGVGLVLALEGTHRLETLAVTSDTVGWSFDVYVADRGSGDLAGWGTPIASAADVQPDGTRVDLAGVEGSFVLVWITDLGAPAPRFKVEIAEAVVTGR